MGDTVLLNRLRDGVEAWNGWRGRHRSEQVDLSGLDLTRADLRRADLANANFTGACLRGARLMGANLGRATLTEADFRQANLAEANLEGATAIRANFVEADLHWSRLGGANLTRASFYGADLTGSDLAGAQMYRADARWANLAECVITDANLTDADLYHADLRAARLSDTDLSRARLDLATLADGEIVNCNIYGVSAWDVKLERTVQNELVISQPGEPVLAIDDLDAAQFINMLLHSPVLRDRVCAVTSRIALVLAARVPGSEDRIADLERALSDAGWISVHYDVGAAHTQELPAMLQALMRFCGAVVADIEDVAPFADTVLDAAAANICRVLPVYRTADLDPAAVIDLARHPDHTAAPRPYRDIKALVADLPSK